MSKGSRGNPQELAIQAGDVGLSVAKVGVYICRARRTERTTGYLKNEHIDMKTSNTSHGSGNTDLMEEEPMTWLRT